MKKRVKNTTLYRILDLFYPCYCRGCGRVGQFFCQRCIIYNEAINPPFYVSYDKDFEVIMAYGLREGILDEMIHEYKFNSNIRLASVFSYMLFRILDGHLPKNAVFVPLPTNTNHIRERGFDHISEICNRLSNKTGVLCDLALVRDANTVQVGTDEATRLTQARRAYKLREGVKICSDKTYILIDDVWTTGASMREACRLLKRYGAVHVYGVILAKNSGYNFAEKKTSD